MKAQSQNSDGIKTLTFGYPHGTIAPIQDVGGQQVIFRGQSCQIDSIQIGTTMYGSQNPNKGTSQPPQGGSGTLPANGVFTLKEMQGVNNGPLHYIKISINGSTLTAGTKSDGNCLLLVPDLQVKFYQIYYGDNEVNQIVFEVVQDS